MKKTDEQKISQSPFTTLFPVDVNKKKLHNAIEELKSFNLNHEKRAISLLESNPAAINQILTLYKNLKKYGMVVTDEVHSFVENHVDDAGNLSKVINLLFLNKIEPNSVPFESISKAASAYAPISQSFNLFITKRQLRLPTVLLLFSFPEEAIELASLSISLQNRGYSIEDLIKESLRRVPDELLSKCIKLITLVLDGGFFYPEYINAVLAMGNNVTQVIEGIERLNTSEYLSAAYLELSKLNPENGLTFAKNIELLADAGMIDPQNKTQLSMISTCGIGTFFLLQQLKWTDSLNSETFAKVLKYDVIQKDDRVVKAFSELPLMERLSGDEVEFILKCMSEKTQECAIDSIVELLESHSLTKRTTYRGA